MQSEVQIPLYECRQQFRQKRLHGNEAANDIHTTESGPLSACPGASVKSAEICRPRFFTGEGSQDQAGAICRFKAWTYTSKLPMLTLFSVLLMLRWRKDSAADDMHTAYQSFVQC